MSKQKLLSILRKLVIFMLIVNAVFLFGKSGYASGIKNKLHPVQNSNISAGTATVSGVGLELIEMVQPKAVIVCGGENGKFGTAYNSTVMTDFLHFSADFGEALGSAGRPEKLTEEEFRDRLEKCGVSLKLYCQYPLELLSGLLGAEMSSEAAADRTDFLCLCVSNNQTELCYRAANGEFWECSTAVPQEGLQNRISEYLPNNAEYAFENSNLNGGDDYAVLVDLQADMPIVRYAAVIPQNGKETDAVLQSMGMNSFMANSYEEADGTVVFVDEETTLRIGPDGSILFRRSGFSEVSGETTVSAPVSLAWKIAEQVLCQNCGEANVIFAGILQNNGQRTDTVYLDYAVNGIPIQLGSGHAAEIVSRGETVIQVRLQEKQFFTDEETEAVLPCLQAFAIACAENATADLNYVDYGTEMKCCWVNANG